MAGVIDKTGTLVNSTSTLCYNRDYRLTLGVIVKNLDATSMWTFMADAYATCGWAVGDQAPAPYHLQGIEVLDIAVEPLNKVSCTTAKVTVIFGVAPVRVTKYGEDIRWTWEETSTVRTEQCAFQTKSESDNSPGDAIQLKYWPPDPKNTTGDGYMIAYVLDANGVEKGWNIADNQRRYNRTHTATKYRGWVTAVARAKLSKAWIDFAPTTRDPRLWSNILSGKVNADLESVGSTAADKTRGIWMCQGCAVSSPNQGLIWDVRVTFTRNDFGWDPILLYQDPNWQNFTPKEVGDLMNGTVASNFEKFKLPYPFTYVDRTLVSTVVGKGGKPFGGLHPRMHCKFDFNTAPYGINLKEIT